MARRACRFTVAEKFALAGCRLRQCRDRTRHGSLRQSTILWRSIMFIRAYARDPAALLAGLNVPFSQPACQAL